MFSEKEGVEISTLGNEMVRNALAAMMKSKNISRALEGKDTRSSVKHAIKDYIENNAGFTYKSSPLRKVISFLSSKSTMSTSALSNNFSLSLDNSVDR